MVTQELELHSVGHMDPGRGFSRVVHPTHQLIVAVG
jgi:hypothetical protein